MPRAPAAPGGTPVLAPLAATIAWLIDLAWQGGGARPAFLAPPHLAAAVLVVAAGVAVWRGARVAGPTRLGALGAALAGVALPLDAWWHASSGAPEAVLTPAHALEAVGLGLVLAAGLWAALALPAPSGRPDWRGPVAAALLLVWATVMGVEYLGRPNLWHGPEFYQVSAAVFPALLALPAAASDRAWRASLAAAGYWAILLGVRGLVLAIPESAGAFVPPPLPLLLPLPALAIDLVARRARRVTQSVLVQAAGLGAAFVALMLAAHWPAADHLLGAAGRHPVLAADQWPHHAPPGDWRIQYWTLAPGVRPFVLGVGLAVAAVIRSALVGLWAGARLARTRGGLAPGR